MNTYTIYWFDGNKSKKITVSEDRLLEIVTLLTSKQMLIKKVLYKSHSF